ncbi:MAG: alpha/beta hydrolase, partial [Pseudomonadota bacterium]
LANAVIVGHSMGARVAIEVAARLGGRAGGLALVGIAERLAVNPELRRAAAAGENRAVDMILKWGFGERGPGGASRQNQEPGAEIAAESLGLGAYAPGGGGHVSAPSPKRHARRLLERSLGSALGTDLAACDDDPGAAWSAARVTCPVVVIAGAGDRMTPPAEGRKLAQRIMGAVTVEIPRCGHMCMLEEPAAVTAAIARII